MLSPLEGEVVVGISVLDGVQVLQVVAAAVAIPDVERGQLVKVVAEDLRPAGVLVVVELWGVGLLVSCIKVVMVAPMAQEAVVATTVVVVVDTVIVLLAVGVGDLVMRAAALTLQQ